MRIVVVCSLLSSYAVAAPAPGEETETELPSAMEEVTTEHSGASVLDGDTFLDLARDTDGDGIRDIADNCPDLANEGQQDSDGDRVGNVCDACTYFGFYDYDHMFLYCGEESLLSAESGSVHYWETFYGAVDNSGCGCGDSDGGRDLYTRGQVNTETVEHYFDPIHHQRDFGSSCEFTEDYCLGSGRLREYYCDNNGLAYEDIECVSGCRNGACLCPTTDGNYDPFTADTTAGEVCIDGDRLREYICETDGSGEPQAVASTVHCSYGCADAACVCSDSDNGFDLDVAGVFAGEEERCLDERVVLEFVPTIDTETQACHSGRREHTCYGRCEEGVCVEPTCRDGLENGDEHGIDCGGFCGPACDRCPARADPMPAHFDWRDYRGGGRISPVRDQGRCGSCWAFAALAAMESLIRIERGSFMDVDLSEMHVVSDCCVECGDCDGGDSLRTLEWIQANAVASEYSFPYDDRGDMSCHLRENWELRSWSIEEVDRQFYRARNREAVKRSIGCNGPVVACGDGHCVLIVGWDDTDNTWLIKNSWGVDWGDRGYGLIRDTHRWVERIDIVSGLIEY